MGITHTDFIIDCWECYKGSQMKLLYLWLAVLLPIAMSRQYQEYRGYDDHDESPAHGCHDELRRCSPSSCRWNGDRCKKTCGLCKDHDNHDDHSFRPKRPFPKEVSKPARGCQDKRNHCRRGDCRWDGDMCKKTCGLCKAHDNYDDHYSPHRPKTTFPPELERPDRTCKDESRRCKRSQCKWYGGRCKKTCGLCNDKDHLDDHDDHDDHDNNDYDEKNEDQDYDYHDEDDSCVDSYNDCPRIARNNLCDIYPGKCCKSCKGSREKPVSRCKDESTHCRTSKRFMCKTYPDKCEKTCGKCKETKKNSKCKDERDNCRTYKKFMCKNYPDKCEKTCGKCERKEERPVSRCKDENDHCKPYKEFMCKNYPNKCKKTCGKCSRNGW